MSDETIVYVIMASQFPESWVHSVCRDNLTAEESCAKLNAEPPEGILKDHYYIEEHVLYG